MKRHWKWNRKKGKWVPRNTPYDGHYYCAQCSRWIPKTEAKQSQNGAPQCPKCGKVLRTRPRIYGKRKPKKSTLAENASSLHSLAAADRQTNFVAEPIRKTAKLKPSENPCQYNEENTRLMEGCKK